MGAEALASGGGTPAEDEDEDAFALATTGDATFAFAIAIEGAALFTFATLGAIEDDDPEPLGSSSDPGNPAPIIETSR